MSVTLPVPNDDPACHCRLAKPGGDVTPPGFVMVETQDAGTVFYDRECPNHGDMIRFLQDGIAGLSRTPDRLAVQAHVVPARPVVDDAVEYLAMLSFWSTRKLDMHLPWRAAPAPLIDWVDQNLGPRPSPHHELVKVRPDDIWAPGNMEWQLPTSYQPPSYHDLYVTAPDIERARLFDLPYGLHVSCDRTRGWALWDTVNVGRRRLIGGEYEGPEKWLILDVAGHVIVDSKNRREEDDGEHRQAAEEDRTGAAGGPGGGPGTG